MHFLAVDGGDPITLRLFLVVVGGVVTLAGGVVLQVVIVPEVQARSRRRERWEDDLAELWSLLDEQVPRAVRRYRTTANVVRLMENIRDEPDINRRLYEEQQERLVAERAQARSTVEEHLDRLSVVEARVRRINSDEPLWQQLQLRLRLYQVFLPSFLWTAAGETVNAPTDEQIDSAWEVQEGHRTTVIRLLEPVVTSMRPPRTRMRRLARRLRAAHPEFAGP